MVGINEVKFLTRLSLHGQKIYLFHIPRFTSNFKMTKNKVFIGLFCFSISFLISYSLLPNSILFKRVQALFQDKVLVGGLTITIKDDISPTSEITNLTKQNQKTVKIEYLSADIGSGVEKVELWQRDLYSDWRLAADQIESEGEFLLFDLEDNVYQWLTIAVDKAGNRQTNNPRELAGQQFQNWQFSTLQIDSQPPSLAFSIPEFQCDSSMIEQVIDSQGDKRINLSVSQTGSWLAFNYRLAATAMSEIVSFQVFIDDQLIYVDGAGEKNGWVAYSGDQQILFPLKNQQGEIEVLFHLVNNKPDSSPAKLEINNMCVVDIDDIENFSEDNKIYVVRHDLGSGIKGNLIKEEIMYSDLEDKDFKAVDYAGNTSWLQF